jgi:mannose-6-phosphate isomerase-like protein (cupin superfamily)
MFSMGHGAVCERIFRALRRKNRRRRRFNLRPGGDIVSYRSTPTRTRAGAMPYKPVSFSEKFALFQEHWKPKVIAEMNDYQFKVVKIEGDFIWHDHEDTDETFIVLDGALRIDFRDGHVDLKEGEMYVVPKGVEHKPYAEREVKLLLIEPRGVTNTGHEKSERTAENDVWI